MTTLDLVSGSATAVALLATSALIGFYAGRRVAVAIMREANAVLRAMREISDAQAELERAALLLLAAIPDASAAYPPLVELSRAAANVQAVRHRCSERALLS